METRGDPNEKLVDVFGTKQESEAMVVQALLESAGIESTMTALDAPQDIYPGVGGSIIRVREEQAEEARSVIAEYHNHPLAEEVEIAEVIDLSTEPQDKPKDS
jgi:hypothetical protein